MNKKKSIKKDNISFSMNERLLKIFDEYLKEINVPKRSRYIEKLIREDMEKRGKDVSIDF